MDMRMPEKKGTPADFALRAMDIARACREQADNAQSTSDRERWLEFARRWDNLAHKAAEYGMQQLAR